MLTQTSCLRLLQAEWRFTFPGWDEAGDPDKHLSCQLRLWRGVFQQHQWTCQGLHSPPACQGPKVWSHFWFHGSPNEETSVMWNVHFFLLVNRLLVQKENDNWWQPWTPLDQGEPFISRFCSSTLSRSQNEQRNENTNCGAAVIQPWQVQNYTQPFFYWFLTWCTVDNSRSPTEIFFADLWNCQKCVIGCSVVESLTLTLPGAFP